VKGGHPVIDTDRPINDSCGNVPVTYTLKQISYSKNRIIVSKIEPNNWLFPRVGTYRFESIYSLNKKFSHQNKKIFSSAKKNVAFRNDRLQCDMRHICGSIE
jgi:hypothetical protein